MVFEYEAAVEKLSPTSGVAAVVLHPGWVKTDMGGANAPLEIPDSVSGMRAVIARLGPKDSGRFYDYKGKELPW